MIISTLYRYIVKWFSLPYDQPNDIRQIFVNGMWDLIGFALFLLLSAMLYNRYVLKQGESMKVTGSSVLLVVVFMVLFNLVRTMIEI